MMDIARRMVHPTLTGLPRKDQNRERARPREKQSRGGTSCPRTIGRSIQTRRATHRFALAQRRPLASSRLRQTYQPFEPSRTPRLCRDPRCRKIHMRGIHHEDDRGAHSIRRLDVRQLSARVRLFQFTAGGVCHAAAVRAPRPRYPVAIIGGLLHENPFFVPPQELLRQVLQRGGERPKAYRG